MTLVGGWVDWWTGVCCSWQTWVLHIFRLRLLNFFRKCSIIGIFNSVVVSIIISVLLGVGLLCGNTFHRHRHFEIWHPS